MHILLVLWGVIHFYFAFKCVDVAKEKNRSNNLWVILALLFGIIAYFVAVYLPPISLNEGDKSKEE